MTDQDKILDFIKANGPTLPAKVAKSINSNILLASAHLSDLVSQGKVKFSKLKIGGSPLYYLAGQENKLFSFAQGNVNHKDYMVLVEIKEKEILRETDLDLLSKVALRSLKDFAVPLQVTTKNSKEIFWKWHLTSAQRANELISSLIRTESTQDTGKEVSDLEIKKTSELTETSFEKETVLVSENAVASEPQEEASPVAQKELNVYNKTKPRKEIKKKSEEIDKKETEIKQEPTLKKQSKVVEPVKEETEESGKKPLLQKIRDKIQRKRRVVNKDDFGPVVEKFLQELEIEVENKEIIRKNNEISYVVTVPSVVGKINYFCKAKKKKRVDEKDLSTAYMEAQIKKYPLLFIYSEDINSKAKEMLDSGAFENAIVKKLQ